MAVEDRVRWDQYYRQISDQSYPAPDPLLLQFTPPPAEDALDAPRALDFACGLAQNGLWLAEQGYSADAIDISRIALNRVRSEMAIRNLRNVNLLQADVDTVELDTDKYDLITVARYLKRESFESLKSATQSGGRILYETFNLRYLDFVPDFNRAYLLEIDELPSYFTDWEILHHDEEGHISRLVAIRPTDG